MTTIPYYLLHDPSFRPNYVPPPEAHFYNRLRKLNINTRPAEDEDEDLPTCEVCKKVIPSQEIYYTGVDGRDYCQHCYDYDVHGISEE